MKIENFSLQFYEDVVDIWKKTGISITSSDTKEGINIMLNKNPDLCLIAKIDEKVIGVVMGGFDGRRGYVHHLAIDPEYQKKGYGRLLMDELIERLKKKRIHKVHLFIEKHNEDVIAFYNKLDWEIRKDLVMMSFIPDKKLYMPKI
ncbi:MAG: GNAT family N-acetyltransferase [Candidatus Hermodarchaeota archaeon]